MEESEKQKRWEKQESENEAEEKAKADKHKESPWPWAECCLFQELRVSPGQQAGTTQDSTTTWTSLKQTAPQTETHAHQHLNFDLVTISRESESSCT